MKLDKEDFLKKYKSLHNDELIKMHNNTDLIDIARLALNEEMNCRGLSETEIQKINIEREQEKIKSFIEKPLPAQPKVWVGFVIALLFFLGEFALISIGESGFLSIALIALSLTGSFYWFFCIQRMHQILNGLTLEGHPISARKVVVYHFIPIFNFFWMFKWPIEFSKTINRVSQNQMIHGSLVGIFIFLSVFILRLDIAIGLAWLFSIALFLNKKIYSAVKSTNMGKTV